MKITLLSICAATLALTSLITSANDDGKLEHSCKAMCEDIVKTFSAGMSEKHQIMSCKQKGDVDGDAFTLIEGMMSCKVGYLGGKEENNIQRIETYTVTLDREELK